ncbi:EF-hand domain-containing protein [Henriciella aquimarina]|uniref:EF-hand domain-containing protein n=1 Tax=Henriciella aquimarina TaxID=545261 RepID=UPI001301ECE3|nr:EF-hand domain-containing protein [Henriciella aquimarina]
MKFLNLFLITAASAATVACATATGETTTAASADASQTASADTASSDTADAQPRRSARGHSKAAFFEKYDTNGDGKISEAEFMAERKTGYDRRDADSDGNVHSEEYVSEYEVRLIKQLEDQHKRQIDQAEFRFTVLDTNEDGVLSLEEFNASGKRMFSTLDTNGDGIIDEQNNKEAY